MSSYHQLMYHIVIRTKDNRRTIDTNQSRHLFAYIGGIIKNKNCHLYRINGIEDHLHILTDIHPSIALADFIRDLKVSTSIGMKNCGFFPSFEGWSEKYGAFTCSYPVSYTHLRAHETVLDLVCRLLLEKKKKNTNTLHKSKTTYNNKTQRGTIRH